jgi:hypothetical protein
MFETIVLDMGLGMCILVGLYILYFFIDWVCHGCPERFPYDESQLHGPTTYL